MMSERAPEFLDSSEEERYMRLIEAATKERGLLSVTFEWNGGTANVSYIPRERYLSDGIDPEMSAPTWGVVFLKPELLEQNDSLVRIKYVQDAFYLEEGGHLGVLSDSHEATYRKDNGEEIPVPGKESLTVDALRNALSEDPYRPVVKDEFYGQLIPLLEHGMMLDDAAFLEIEEA